MPSGKVHLRIEAALLAVWGAGAVFGTHRGWLGSAALTGFLVAYVASMLLLSPDLDLARSDSYRRWGPLRFVWLPYATAFRHRRISHHPLFGPITRIGYVGLLAVLSLAAYGAVRRGATLRFVVPLDTALAVLVGLYLPNLTHIAADGLQSLWARWRGRLYVP